MSDLHPCPACRRHVASGEDRCPFCDAALATPQQHADPPSGRRTRAAVFATLTAVVAAAGCGGKAKNDQPPPPPQVDAAVADPTTPDADPNAIVDEPEPDWRYRERPACVNGVCPPYGAPPPRRRVV